MPAIRTEITEIVTGLGMFDYPDLEHALEVRPRHFEGVPSDTYDRLREAHAGGAHGSLFATAWDNGVRFSRSVEGLRGRPPWLVEWKGSHRPPGYEQLPADLRVDHVYLVSCKYGSNILTNSSPSNLFDRMLVDRVDGRSDWYLEVAPEAYQALYEECRDLVGDARLPKAVADLSQADRDHLKAAMPRRLQGGALVAYRRLADAVSVASSRRWGRHLSSPAAREQMVWRLLRLQAAPYFVLGQSADGRPLAYRVSTPWDLRASFRFGGFEHRGVLGRGQPVVGWSATFRSRSSGVEQVVEGHIQVRWSHGKFARPPEAKVYLDTHHHLVPGYVPLVLPRGDDLFG